MIGQGSFGLVRECFTIAGNLKRAVKIIMKSAMDEELMESFKIEVATLKVLDHPNILRLFEVFQDKKKYFLVTEMCNGGELFDEIINQGHLSEKDAANVLLQMLKSISYCHNQGIVHRDLKPENMLIDKD